MLNTKSISRSAMSFVMAASAFMIAAPASAQMQVFEDYEPSDAVYEMVTVNIEPGEFETYLENLKETWVQGNEIAKRLGHIEDYAIYANPNGAGEALDMVLMIKYSSTTDLAPSKERYQAFMREWGKQREESSQKTVREVYNNIRELTGQYHLREIILK